MQQSDSGVVSTLFWGADRVATTRCMRVASPTQSILLNKGLQVTYYTMMIERTLLTNNSESQDMVPFSFNSNERTHKHTNYSSFFLSCIKHSTSTQSRPFPPSLSLQMLWLIER